MVINIGWAKDGRFDAIEEEIRTLKKACWQQDPESDHRDLSSDRRRKDQNMWKLLPLQVQIISRPLLDSPKAGATFEDIKLFSEHIGPNVKMKAAGGILLWMMRRNS